MVARRGERDRSAGRALGARRSSRGEPSAVRERTRLTVRSSRGVGWANGGVDPVARRCPERAACGGTAPVAPEPRAWRWISTTVRRVISGWVDERAHRATPSVRADGDPAVLGGVEHGRRRRARPCGGDPVRPTTNVKRYSSPSISRNGETWNTLSARAVPVPSRGVEVVEQVGVDSPKVLFTSATTNASRPSSWWQNHQLTGLNTCPRTRRLVRTRTGPVGRTVPWWRATAAASRGGADRRGRGGRRRGSRRQLARRFTPNPRTSRSRRGELVEVDQGVVGAVAERVGARPAPVPDRPDVQGRRHDAVTPATGRRGG
jgi:hypothetical protein